MQRLGRSLLLIYGSFALYVFFRADSMIFLPQPASYQDTADIVKSDLNTLIHKLGFHEYFESQKSVVESLTKGYGGNNFSWTASSYIHLNATRKLAITDL